MGLTLVMSSAWNRVEESLAGSTSSENRCPEGVVPQRTSSVQSRQEQWVRGRSRPTPSQGTESGSGPVTGHFEPGVRKLGPAEAPKPLLHPETAGQKKAWAVQDMERGAAWGTRTPDLLLTKELLYRLS